MTANLVNHVGVLVVDLEQAMADFGERLGVTFPNPQDRLIEIETDGSPVQYQLRFVYSAEGPPFIELIEGVKDGIWTGEGGEGVHHLGFSQPDLDGRIGELEACGLAMEAVARRDGSAYLAYLAPALLHQVRVELVDARRARKASP